MESSHKKIDFLSTETKKVKKGYNNKAFTLALDAIEENQINIENTVEKGFSNGISKEKEKIIEIMRVVKNVDTNDFSVIKDQMVQTSSYEEDKTDKLYKKVLQA